MLQNTYCMLDIQDTIRMYETMFDTFQELANCRQGTQQFYIIPEVDVGLTNLMKYISEAPLELVPPK